MESISYLGQRVWPRDNKGRYSSSLWARTKYRIRFAIRWLAFRFAVASVAVALLSAGYVYATLTNSNTINYVAPSDAQAPQEAQVLKAIADCESGNGKPGSGRQFLPNGNVVTHTNINGTVDEGMYGINMSAGHIIEMAKMHIDPATEQGNYAYAQHLYQIHGTEDWQASKSCWYK